MCRSKAQGGRRCPGRQKQSQIDSTVIPSPASFVRDSVHVQAQGVLDNGLNYVDVSGPAIEAGYFQSKQLMGSIDPGTLNDESYRQFGFVHPSEQPRDDFARRSQRLERHSPYSEEEWTSAADEEDSSPQIRAIRAYSRHAYRDINQKLRNNEDFNEYEQEIVGPLDSVLENGPKVQRIVYRGVKCLNGGNSNLYPQYDEYTKQFDLGKEIVFDGFQSTSLSRKIASDFSENTVLFEILTPSGLNISKPSFIHDEEEVLLPRQSRYMVVGKHQDKDEYGRDLLNGCVIQLVAIDDSSHILAPHLPEKESQ